MNIEMNWWLLLVTGFIPLMVGFVWYHPKVFGNIWMQVNGFKQEDLQSGNMVKIFALVYIFGCMFSMAVMAIVIHQLGLMGMMANDKSPEAIAIFNDMMAKYGKEFRTFKHGAFHGTISAILIALPLIAINALFEKRGFKYILIHVGYWLVTFILIGGVICQFL
jgi:hypothetical protein